MSEEIVNIKKKLKSIEAGGELWRIPAEDTYSMIMSGSTLIVGKNGKVDAYLSSNGKLLWSAAINGKVYGLAAANNRLFASTDLGTIHCFAKPTVAKISEIRPSIDPNPFPKDKFTPFAFLYSFLLYLNLDSRPIANDIVHGRQPAERHQLFHVLSIRFNFEIDPDLLISSSDLIG